MVKSVYAPLCVEWIALRRDLRVVLVLRNPLNVISSWLELGWLSRGRELLMTLDPGAADELAARFEAPRPPAVSLLAGAAWLVGVLTCALEEAARRNPEWPCVVHEALCTDPSGEFAALASNAGLRWSVDGERVLEAMNHPGSGYETMRVAAEMSGAWRTRLSAEQVREIKRVLDLLPIETSS